LAPHDLRRTCARLCHQAGGELDQIQFLLGHYALSRILTTWYHTSLSPKVHLG
jgi:integrase